MLLAIQSTIPKSLLHHHHHHHHHHSVSLSSPLSHSLSFPSGSRSKKHPVIRCSISKLANMFENFVFSLLPQPSKEEALEVIEGLKKFGNYKRALQVCEVMNRKQESFGMTMTTTDAAIQLDLIDKVHGTFAAEDYFLKLPETLKDEQTHIVLLISYANSKMREKAESIHTQMITRGYPMDPLQFYVMMNLYKDLKEYDKVDLLVSEMRQKNIPLDVDCYNVWLSCFVDQGSVEKVEQVFEQMEQDSTVNPDWDSFYLMGLFYIRVGLLEKAEECIKMCESRITGQDRIFYYHNVIRLYGNLGKREEVYRAWNVFKKISPKTSMMGYHTMISSLVRLGDIEGAEQLYAEWLSVTPTNNPKIVNLLLSYYTRNGLLVKAEALLDRMVESGGKPNPRTWEILAEGHIRERKVSEALSCLKEAVLVRGSENWKPRPVNVSSILSICEQNDDMQSKDVLMGLLSQVGCFEDEAYKSNVPSTGGVATVRDEDEDSYEDEILND